MCTKTKDKSKRKSGEKNLFQNIYYIFIHNFRKKYISKYKYILMKITVFLQLNRVPV